MRLDSGTQVNSAGVRLRCWAAPPSITEEDIEEEIEEDAVSLRAMPAQGKHKLLHKIFNVIVIDENPKVPFTK